MLLFSSRSRLQHGLSFQNYFGELFKYIKDLLKSPASEGEEKLELHVDTELGIDAALNENGSKLRVKD
ncbi:hypothetical protein GCK32_001490 [Trichostrongylus colubriformis]|uniref:Uncharacterized protein n=1 Tax=Trichostrongylus colubriformis TaxID=6319 RepID=A0AAN8EWH1_TRICO